MALNKLKYNSLNVTPVANKAISFDSDPDALEATLEGGAMTFIKKLTASSDSTLSFVDGASSVVLDSTYKEYLFLFKDIHPSNDARDFQFNMSTDSGSNYNVTKTSTSFRAYNQESGAASALEYIADDDLAQGTGFQNLSDAIDGANDASCSGSLHIFNPSSTTFVKHYIANTTFLAHSGSSEYSMNMFVAGYGNTTSAVDAIRFQMNSNNIDAGTITLYGIN
jgi:predicted NAD/FAD-binding protein